jgi:hypothetical protein
MLHTKFSIKNLFFIVYSHKEQKILYIQVIYCTVQEPKSGVKRSTQVAVINRIYSVVGPYDQVEREDWKKKKSVGR